MPRIRHHRFRLFGGGRYIDIEIDLDLIQRPTAHNVAVNVIAKAEAYLAARPTRAEWRGSWV